VRRIGVLESRAPSGEAAWHEEFRKFVAELGALGWVEGRNLVIEHRSSEGEAARLRQAARDLVGLNVELIVAIGIGPVLAAKEASSQIPIVFLGGDPVNLQLVKRLDDPTRNITGFYLNFKAFDEKKLQFTRELLPGINRIALIYDGADLPRKQALTAQARIYESVGMQLLVIEIRSPSDIASAVETAVDRGAQAVTVLAQGFWQQDEREDVLTREANRRRLPLIVPSGEWSERGALMGLEGDPEHDEFFRAAAYFVDKILRGARPADLPFQQVMRIGLSINAKTAKEIGVTIPSALLARADRVYR